MSAADAARYPLLRLAFWTLLLLAGGALWAAPLGGAEGGRAWRALLVNFLFFTSVAGGLVVWPALVETCNGRWHRGLEKTAAAGAAFSLPSLLILIALWVASPHWAPWYSRAFHQGVWLHTSFLFGRDLAALALFWGVALRYLVLRRRGEGKVTAAWLLVVYALSFTLIGLDQVMALDPHWRSSLAGGYFFMSGLYVAVCAWAFLAAFRQEAAVDQLHDLGRLVVAFSLMTSYLMYSQLLPIWYENLPHEARFVAPRAGGIPHWRNVSFLLLATVYFGPLILLLTERSKRNRFSLALICLLVLCGMWLERWWLVAPTLAPLSEVGMVELGGAAACLGLLGVGMELYHRRLPAGRGGEGS